MASQALAASADEPTARSRVTPADRRSRAAAELSRINAETRKLAAEAEKLEAEEQRLLRSIVRDAWTTALAIFAAGPAAPQFANKVGWLYEGPCCSDTDSVWRPQGDRDWWYAVKYGMMIFAALGAAYLVHITLL